MVATVWYNSKYCVWTPGFHVLILDGSVLYSLYGLHRKCLAEIKTTIFYIAFSPLIYQQKLSHNAI